MPFPTRDETEAVLLGLVRGTLTPSEANDWACPFVIDETSHPSDMDEAVWRALNQLCGADLQVSPSAYLHGPSDFRDWLDQFRLAVHPSPDSDS